MVSLTSAMQHADPYSAGDQTEKALVGLPTDEMPSSTRSRAVGGRSTRAFLRSVALRALLRACMGRAGQNTGYRDTYRQAEQKLMRYLLNTSGTMVRRTRHGVISIRQAHLGGQRTEAPPLWGSVG